MIRINCSDGTICIDECAAILSPVLRMLIERSGPNITTHFPQKTFARLVRKLYQTLIRIRCGSIEFSSQAVDLLEQYEVFDYYAMDTLMLQTKILNNPFVFCDADLFEMAAKLIPRDDLANACLRVVTNPKKSAMDKKILEKVFEFAAPFVWNFERRFVVRYSNTKPQTWNEIIYKSTINLILRIYLLEYLLPTLEHDRRNIFYTYNEWLIDHGGPRPILREFIKHMRLLTSFCNPNCVNEYLIALEFPHDPIHAKVFAKILVGKWFELEPVFI